MLVRAGLVYDKEFNPKAPGDTPTWEEIIACMDRDIDPADVDFDEMLSDRPSMFSCVDIATKMRPRESMVPESTSTVLPPTSIPAVLILSMLKRMVKDIPTSTLRPSKRVKTSAPKKKATQVLARDSGEEATPSIGFESQVGSAALPATMPRAQVVDLESSATVFGQGVAHPYERGGKAPTAGSSLPNYDERYLDLTYIIPPNLEVTGEAPWKARKFHYHTVKPLLAKEVATQYKNLADAYDLFANSPSILLRFVD
ncbi:hypothetical protein LIER_01899 [Lithospermum erythrorhizon]|uniref:Uncharacterized protein n=1 Tax=Lithospermum erythrorhizon TaxID=34254 RepID=A0AAV3NS49_LITER